MAINYKHIFNIVLFCNSSMILPHTVNYYYLSLKVELFVPYVFFRLMYPTLFIMIKTAFLLTIASSMSQAIPRPWNQLHPGEMWLVIKIVAPRGLCLISTVGRNNKRVFKQPLALARQSQTTEWNSWLKISLYSTIRSRC